MTDQELNEAVARKLGMGEYDSTYIVDRKVVSGVKPFSTSIAAAWEIISDRKGVQVWSDSENGKWRCTLWLEKDANGNTPLAEADTAPLAICLAFLKLP